MLSTIGLFFGDELVIDADYGDFHNTISVATAGANVLVSLQGGNDDRTVSFPARSIRTIGIYGRGGNDTINFNVGAWGNGRNELTIQIDGGGGNDIINVDAIPRDLYSPQLYGGPGYDEVNFGRFLGNLDNIRSSVWVVGADKLTLNDVTNWGGNRRFTLNSSTAPQSYPEGTVEMPGGNIIRYQNSGATVGSIVLTTGSGATVNVYGTDARVSTEIVGASNVKLGEPSTNRATLRSGSYTDRIDGYLRIRTTGFGATALTIDDSANTAARTVGILNNAVYGFTDYPIFFDLAWISKLTVNAGSGGNQFYVLDTWSSFLGNSPITLNTGHGADTTTIQRTNAGVTINGQHGLDTVNVGLNGSVQNIRNTLTVTNVGSYSAVNIDNSTDAVGRTGIIYKNGSYNVISGLIPAGDIVLRSSDLRSLAISTGSGDDAFRIHDTAKSNWAGGLSTSIRTGDGNDRVTVNGTSGGLALNVQGGSSNSVTVGSDTSGLDRILGNVSISGPGGTNDVTIQDRPTLTGRDLRHTITATAYHRSGAAPVSLSDVHSFVLLAGSARDTIRVEGNPTVQSSTSFDIQAGPGNDILDVGSTANHLAGIGQVTLNGQQGIDNVILRDHGDANSRNYTLAPAMVVLSDDPVAPISYTAVETLALNGSGGDNVFVLTSTTSETAISIHGGDGVNTLNYSAIQVDVSPILVARYLAEGNAIDAIGVHHGTLVNEVTFADGNLGQAFSFDGVDAYVQVPNAPSLEPTTVSVEAWVNSANTDQRNAYILAKGASSDAAASYALYTGNGGIVFYVFDGVEYVESPADTGIWDGNWHHVVGTYDGAAVRLYVDGAEVGAGNATNIPIGYGLPTSNDLTIGAYAGPSLHAFSGRVDELSIYNRALTLAEIQAISAGGNAGNANGIEVNLPLGTASGLAGGVARVQNVIGSAGNDILVGNGGNVLSGGAGRDLLIAGAWASVLNGGDDQDILIGGTTDYDLNAAPLIMAEWTRHDGVNDHYEARVANLINGLNGAPILNATTVHSNGGGNTLNGNAGLDLYFAQFDLDSSDQDPLAETLVDV